MNKIMINLKLFSELSKFKYLVYLMIITCLLIILVHKEIL